MGDRHTSEDMTLEEARETARMCREGQTIPRYFPFTQYALVVLDDRITELEAQRDELIRALTQIKCELSPYKTNPTADHTGLIDHICAWCGRLTEGKKRGDAIKSKASDKEDKGNDNTTDVRRKPGQIDYGTGG